MAPQNGNTTITTMAPVGGNGPLEPLRTPYVPLQRVILIEDDPPSKRICFLWGLIGCVPLKTLGCCGGPRRARLALEWDSRGQFPPAAIMAGLVVLVCCCHHPRTGVDRNPGILHIVGMIL